MQLPVLYAITIFSILFTGRSNGALAFPKGISEIVPPAPIALLALNRIPRSSEISSPLNTTELLLNPPTLGVDVHDIQCDGSQYGALDASDVTDCASALAMIPPSTRIITFAERQTLHLESWMYPLPWRWMGGIVPRTTQENIRRVLILLPENANCLIQPSLKPGATTGRLRINELREAARNLLFVCGQSRLQGGTVSNLGE